MERTYNQCEYQSHTDLGDHFIQWFEPDYWDEYDYGVTETYFFMVTYTGFGPHFSDEPLLNLEKLHLNSWSVTPNPVNDILQISTERLNRAQLIISSVTGIKIMEKSLERTENTLDLSSFKSGIYLVTIQTESATEVFKIVKL